MCGLYKRGGEMGRSSKGLSLQYTYVGLKSVQSSNLLATGIVV